MRARKPLHTLHAVPTPTQDIPFSLRMKIHYFALNNLFTVTEDVKNDGKSPKKIINVKVSLACVAK